MSKQTIFPWHKNNNIQFYIDGEQFYPAMLKAIAQSEKFILMEMYLFESGKVADSFIKAFIQACRHGVTVYLLVDAYGTKGLSKQDQEKLNHAGVKLVFYNPLLIEKFKQNLFRTHRKYLIIDGKTVFVGGAGITDCFAGKHAWRETVVKVQGKVVADWQQLFITNYQHWTTEPLPTLAQSHSNNSTSGVKARLAYTSGGTHYEIKKGLLNRISHTKNTLWLASAYFIPSKKIRNGLRQAAIKGKDVRLLLPGPVIDHPSVRYASQRYYARLLRFGVRIFEYQGRFTHTKMVLVDDWFTIGSCNMDRWNFRWNLEANQEIKGKKIAEEARNILLNDFKNCHEIYYAEWINRSKIQRLKEWMWGKVDLALTKYLMKTTKNKNEK